jgi:hypothetical protein
VVNKSIWSGHVALPAGEFNITAPIWIADNTTIEGAGPGKTIVRKTGAPFGHVFVNSEADKYGASKNSNITLKNLSIDSNGIEIPVSESSPATRGLCQFTYVDGLTVENVEFVNAGKIQYGFHLQSVTQGSFKNVVYHGGKTLCQMQAECADITFDGWECSGGDDAFALNAADWAGDSHRAGDIERITIRNGKILPYINGETRNAVRFLPGSWADWKAGNLYRIADYCVNDGRIYQVASKADPIAGANAPTHTSGVVVGTDGIAWQWLQDGSHHTANIRDVVIDGIKINDSRQFGASVMEGPQMRPEYPGTEGTSEICRVRILSVKLSGKYPGIPLLNISGGHVRDFTLQDVSCHEYFYALRVVGGKHELIAVRGSDLFTGIRQPIVCQETNLETLWIDDCTINGTIPTLLMPLRDYLFNDGSVGKVIVGSQLKV